MKGFTALLRDVPSITSAQFDKIKQKFLWKIESPRLKHLTTRKADLTLSEKWLHTL